LECESAEDYPARNHRSARHHRRAGVGLSLVPAGGHNPLEPAQFGVPIVMGPHYANFTAITEDLRAQNAMRIVAKKELAAALTDLLEHRATAEAMGARAREVFEQQAGATERCVEAIRELLGVNDRVEQKA
jgi:3-deoxy-D-manno-octulosonic-acid transferase